MEWIKPSKTAKIGVELLNSITLSVQDVETSLDHAREAGMTVTERPKYRRIPVFGEVLIGTACVEPSSCPLEFCCFTNRR
jgi:hypothetical protein